MTRDEFWFSHSFRVRYSEIDAQAVVFNAHYLTYFDTAVTEYFRALGYDQFADAKATGIDFHTAKSLVEYKAPIRFDETIDVCVRAARIGRSSVTLLLAIFVGAEEKPRATGEIVWVYTDQASGRTLPVRDDIRTLVAGREVALGQA